MNVRLERLGTTTVVIPQGRMDFATAPIVEKELQEVLGGSPPAALLIDCGALEYVSSAGLRAILLTARAAQKAGVAFALCALRPAVQEVFDLSGFSQIIALHPDRAAALAAVSRK